MIKFTKILLLSSLAMLGTTANAEMITKRPEYRSGFLTSNEYRNRIIKIDFNYKGQDINYYTYSPKTNGINRDLYVLLHGEYSKSNDFFKVTNLHSNITENDFMIAQDSSSQDWYLDESMKEISKEYLVDTIKLFKRNFSINNVYLIGYSSGGSFANEILCDSDIKIDGVANIGGALNQNIIDGCKKINNVKYFYSVGTLDDYYSYDDKLKRNNEFKKPSIDFFTLKKSIDSLSKILKCKSDTKFTLADMRSSDDSTIEHETFLCDEANKNELEVFTVKNMGHNWYNPNFRDYNDFRGNTNLDIDINAKIISFFN